jgi:hypothetical protein
MPRAAAFVGKTSPHAENPPFDGFIFSSAIRKHKRVEGAKYFSRGDEKRPTARACAVGV